MKKEGKRQVCGIVVLTLACVGLLLVLAARWYNPFESRYAATLYFEQIRAVDDQTSQPVGFEIQWDHELITPFVKGSGPAMILTNGDKTVTVAAVGLPLKGGMPVKIAAEGYSPKVICISGEQGGTVQGKAKVEEVRLRRVQGIGR